MNKVLVIDDDSSLLNLMTKVLRKEGYEVFEAGDGGEGVGLARTLIPDLVLCDVNMNGLSGYDVMQRLRSETVTSAIPVVLMTGGSKSGDVRHGMECGADDYLSKPFETTAFLAAVRVRLERQRAIKLHARKNEERLLEVLSATQDLVAIADLDSTRLLYLNDAGRQILGISAKEDISTHRLADFQMDDAAAGGKTTYIARAKRNGVLVSESTFRRRDGQLVPVSQQILIHTSSNGGDYLSVIARDISQRKQAEAELRSREESFRALADNVPDAVARFDRDLRFVYGNPALARALGMRSSEFVGKTNIELGLPAQTEWNTAICRVFEHGQAVTIEFSAVKESGRRFYEARLSPERSAAGEVQNVLAVTRDFTEQRGAEQERQMMEVQLRQAQKLEAIGQLAAGIAHEINTPSQYVGDNTRFVGDSFASISRVLESHKALLQAVRNNCVTPDLLAKTEKILAAEDLDYLLEQIPSAIRETLEGVERITKIVRAMKEFSHPGGKEKSAADLNRAIETTVTVARNEWKYVAELSLDLDASLPLVPCFIGEFNQVILNLIVNAAHAIGDVAKGSPGSKGAIAIRTRRVGNQAEISVSDTGTGIPEAVRPRIFEPFFTTKAVGKGTGQGLSIVYGSIVKKHGGEVSFETELGKGTTFIIRLPL